MKLILKLVTLSVFIAFTACARTGQLYPVAKNSPILHVHFGMIQMVRGTKIGDANIDMPDGEKLQGQYEYFEHGKEGFGRLYSLMYGSVGAGTLGTSTYGSGGGFGTITLNGDHGTSMQCEFYDDFRPTQSGGWGVCKTSDNQLYKLKF